MTTGILIFFMQQVVRECVGFQRSKALCQPGLFCPPPLVATVNWLAWLLVALAPSTTTRIFQPCPLHQADYVLVTVSLRISSVDRIQQCPRVTRNHL